MTSGTVSDAGMSCDFSLIMKCQMVTIRKPGFDHCKRAGFDHVSYYEICARWRSYGDHMVKKNFQLDEKICHCTIYTIGIRFQIIKIMKKRQPVSLTGLFEPSLRTLSQKILMYLNTILKLQFNSISYTNGTVSMETSSMNVYQIIRPGFSKFSDLSTAISVINNRLINHLLKTQSIKTPGRLNDRLANTNWVSRVR